MLILVYNDDERLISLYDRFRSFMEGRYGTDELSFALLIFALLMNLIGGFFFFPLTIFSYLIYIFVFFRLFSKNFFARQKELGFYLGIKRQFTSFFRCIQMKIRDRKTLKYFRCPHCKQQLRAPRGKGKIAVTCQKCHQTFTTKT